MTKEALKLALKALEADPLEMVADVDGHMVFLKDQAITAIKEALANEALEKMAENARELGLDYEPAQRTWVGLTDEEIKLQWSEFWEAECHPWAIDFAKAIEAKLKEKNT